MKKIIFATAMVFMLMVGIGSVSAQSVNIGTGQMDASEFAALKAMVQGKKMVSGDRVSTPPVRTEQYGELQMTPAEFQALQNAVAGKDSGRNVVYAEKNAVQMVDIGTGEMPADEFYALKQMIEHTQTSISEHMALLKQRSSNI